MWTSFCKEVCRAHGGPVQSDRVSSDRSSQFSATPTTRQVGHAELSVQRLLLRAFQQPITGLPFLTTAWVFEGYGQGQVIAILLSRKLDASHVLSTARDSEKHSIPAHFSIEDFGAVAMPLPGTAQCSCYPVTVRLCRAQNSDEWALPVHAARLKSYCRPCVEPMRVVMVSIGAAGNSTRARGRTLWRPTRRPRA